MFAGAKVFTIVDMDKGYWQVVLHPDSRKYTCMAFDIGRYQFKRLPIGSKVVSDIFQKMLDSVFIGLPGVTGIADDMVIFGRNEEEHDRNLILFLETTRKNGLILNKKKLQFKRKKSVFLVTDGILQESSQIQRRLNLFLEWNFHLIKILCILF